MSETTSSHAVPDINTDADSARRERARMRRAAVHVQIRQASDVLAAAGLLLRLNDSVASVGREERG